MKKRANHDIAKSCSCTDRVFYIDFILYLAVVVVVGLGGRERKDSEGGGGRGSEGRRREGRDRGL